MLPELNPEQARHAERVAGCLRQRIAAARGWLPFSEYMRIALYEPGLGYYSAGAAKLGEGGDFTTAPEVSALFGRCVAAQVAEILAAGSGGNGEVLEVGAGTGSLASAMLGELHALGALPRRYRILEVSADLRSRQVARITALGPAIAARVEWLERPPAAPLEGVIVANEVLDALPCERFAWQGNAVWELGVSLDGDGELLEARRPAGVALERAVRALVAAAPGGLPDGYRSETCLRLGSWLAGVTAPLGAGVALFLDYGLPRAQYYLPERADGTLTCHFRHRAHGNALRLPGLEDITAWVDFTALAEAALACGLEVAGFATQAAFLLGLGIEARLAAELDGAHGERERVRLAGEARRLLLPGEMGEAFKAMALSRNFSGDLAGFRLQDLRASL